MSADKLRKMHSHNARGKRDLVMTSYSVHGPLAQSKRYLVMTYRIWSTDFAREANEISL